MTVGQIRDLSLTFFSYQSQIVIEEVVIIDISPVFRMCLSRDFITKLNRYLALDWYHLILRIKHREKINILSESLHPEHITDDANLCFEAADTSTFQQERYCIEIPREEEDKNEQISEEEILLNQFVDSDPFGNFHAARLSAYVIFDRDQVFLKLIKIQEEFDNLFDNHVWIVHFKGVRCKFGPIVGVQLVFLMGLEYPRAYCFQPSCFTDNIE